MNCISKFYFTYRISYFLRNDHALSHFWRIAAMSTAEAEAPADLKAVNE